MDHSMSGREDQITRDEAAYLIPGGTSANRPIRVKAHPGDVPGQQMAQSSLERLLLIALMGLEVGQVTT
jgi:hypothetical protein